MANQTPSTFRRNRHLFVALGLVLVMAGGLFYASRRDIRLPEAPLANVPRAATGVLFVRPDPVLRSPWLHDLFVQRGVDGALANIRQRCQLDPVQQVEDLIFFVEGQDPSALEHLGVVARGPFEHEKLGHCLEQAFREDSLGEMRRIEIDGVPAVKPEHGVTRAAFLGRRGIAVGTVDLVRAMIGTIRDHHASGADDATLHRLWQSVAPGREVVLVAHVPDSFRTKMSEMLGTERASPILAALTGLRSLGLGARVSSGLGLGTVLAFAAEENANAFQTIARTKLDELKDNMLLAFTPFGGIVRRIEMERHGVDVVVTLDVPQEALERALGFVAGLTRRGSSANPLAALAGVPTRPPEPPAPTAGAEIRPAETPAPAATP